MSVINRKDIIEDDALQAPALLGESFKKLSEALSEIIDKTKQLSEGLNDVNGTSSQVKKITGDISIEQKTLSGIQNQVARETAKQNAEYQAQVQVLNQLKKEARDKQALGDREASSINAQNASIQQLSAALRINKEAYSNLRNEHERTSAAGKKLLKTIQAQDKSFKDLTRSIGENRANVGDYKGQLEGLFAKFGETGNKAMEIFKGIGETAASGWGVAAAAIGGAGFALKQFFDRTEEGQEQWATMVDNMSIKWDIFKNKIATGTKETIKSVKSSSGLGNAYSPNISSMSEALNAFRKKTPEEIKEEELQEKIDSLEPQRIANLKEENELLAIRGDKLIKAGKLELDARNTEKGSKPIEERYKAAVEANRLYKEVETAQLALDTKKAGVEIQKIYLSAEGRELLPEDINLINKQTDAIKQQAAAYEVGAKRRVQFEQSLWDQTHNKGKSPIAPTQSGSGNSSAANAEALAYFEANKRNKLQAMLDANNIQVRTTDSDMMFDNAKKRHDDIQKLAEESAKDQEQMRQATLEAEKRFEQKKVEIAQTAASSIINIVESQFAYEQNRIAYNLQMLSETYSEEMSIAGNNTQAKIQLTEQYRAKEKAMHKEMMDLKVKQAEFEKAAAIVDIAIKTTQAIAQTELFAAANWWNPAVVAASQGMVALEVGIGAAQAAAVLAKPVPRYAEGTDSHGGGLAIVGEEGAELIRLPGGGLNITPQSSTLVNLPIGAEVFTHKETMMMLAMAGFNSFDFKKNNQNNIDGKILNELKLLNKNNGRNHPHTDYARSGAMVYEFKKESDTYTRKVRSLYMGQNHRQ